MLHRSSGLYAVLNLSSNGILGFLITMSRKEDGGDNGPGPEPIPLASLGASSVSIHNIMRPGSKCNLAINVLFRSQSRDQDEF